MAIEVNLIENDVKSFQVPMEAEMQKSIVHFERELLKIRSGRAHTSMVENILVPCYGQAPVPLKNVASLAAPEARLITIQPWDNAILDDIEKALKESELGISPVNDGAIIRIQLPNISSDRRDELVKILHKKLEECKVAIRNVRKEFHNIVRDSKKDKVISENFFNRLSDVLQEITDKFTAKADQLSKKKEVDITTV